MKRKLALLIALVVAMTAVFGLVGTGVSNVTAAPAMVMQKVNFTDATVTASLLNVRQGPSTQMPVVCVLKKGSLVKVFGKMNDWYAVYEPNGKCVGAAYSKYLKMAGTAAGTTPDVPTTKPPQTQKATPAPAGLSQDEKALLDLVNAARKKAGAGLLEADMNLMKVARTKAKDMVDNNYFNHNSPTYGSPFDMMKQFGINFKTGGENIAGNPTVQGAFQKWMGSEGHKRNIMNGNYDYTGIGIVSSPTYGKMLVQQFIGK